MPSAVADFFTGLLALLWLAWPFFLLAAFTAALNLRGGPGRAARRVLGLLCLVWVLLAAARLWLGYRGEAPQPLLPERWFWLAGALLLLTAGAAWGWGRWRAYRRLVDAHSLAELQAMPPAEFEQLVAETYRALGSRVDLVGGSGDHGVDLLVTSPQGEKTVVQCKRYRGSVGEPVVRDLLGTMQHEEAAAGALITTGEFTAQARRWAQGKPIQLYDGPAFLKLLQRARRRGGLAAGLPRASAPQAAAPAPAAGSPAPPASTAPSTPPAPPPPPAQSADAPEPPVYPSASVPDCPRCGAPMVLRAARHGPNAGQNFWGCSTYPRCRGVRALDN